MAKKPADTESCDEKADYMKKGKKAATDEEDKKAAAAKSKPDPEDDEDDEDEDEPDDDKDDKKKGKKATSATSAASDEEDEDEPPAKKKSAKPVEPKKAAAAAKDDDDEDVEEPPTAAPKKKSTKANSAAVEISELCTIAGHTELIPKYLSEGRSVDTVRRWLSARRVRETSENPVNSTFSIGTPAGAGQQSLLDKAISQAQSMSLNSGGTVSRSQALQQILAANPHVYDAYDEDRRRVALQGTNKDIVAFAQQQRQTMAALKLGTEFGSPPSMR